MRGLPAPVRSRSDPNERWKRGEDGISLTKFDERVRARNRFYLAMVQTCEFPEELVEVLTRKDGPEGADRRPSHMDSRGWRGRTAVADSPPDNLRRIFGVSVTTINHNIRPKGQHGGPGLQEQRVSMVWRSTDASTAQHGNAQVNRTSESEESATNIKK